MRVTTARWTVTRVEMVITDLDAHPTDYEERLRAMGVIK